VAHPFAEPTNAQEWWISGAAVAIGLAGIAVAWVLYGAKRVPVPKPVRLFQKKFYWDEIYDFLFYYPSDLLARGLYAFVEKPLIGGSIAALTGTADLGARELARTQTGLVRSYALALAGGLAILAVVFLAAR